jgi:hypothetical protein
MTKKITFDKSGGHRVLGYEMLGKEKEMSRQTHLRLEHLERRELLNATAIVSEMTPDNSMATAMDLRTLVGSETVTGVVGNTQHDIKVNVNGVAILSATVNTAASASLVARDVAGTVIAVADSGGTISSKWVLGTNGPFYFQLIPLRDGGSTPFALTITVTPVANFVNSPILSGHANSPTEAALNWNQIADARSIDVYRIDGSSIIRLASLDPSSTGYVASNLPAGAQTKFFVEAVGPANSADSNTISVSLPAPIPISAPSGLKLANVTANQATVVWSSVPGVLGYEVHVVSNSNDIRLASLGSESTSFTISGLMPNSTIQVLVRAIGPYNTADSQRITIVTASAATSPLAWGAKVSPEFAEKVRRIAADLGTNPNYLMAIMAFESAETFSPSIRNGAGSGAVGLIQFTGLTAFELLNPAIYISNPKYQPTAKQMAAAIDQFSGMTALQQLDYVKLYLQPYQGKMNSLSDAYMAVLWPLAVGKPDTFVLFSQGTIWYTQNKGLDANHDGRVTKAEPTAAVQAKLNKGLLAGYVA